MSQPKVWTQYTLQKTTTYDALLPGDGPAAWGTDHTQEPFYTTGNFLSAFGALFTLTATPTLFLGAKVKIQPTYVFSSQHPEIELWTYDGAAWTKRLTTIVDVGLNPNGGCVTNRTRVFDLLLDTALAGVTKVWVTLDPQGATGNLIFRCHLYEQVENTDTADPFAAATGSPEFTSSRPRNSTAAGIAGSKYVNLAYTVDITPSAEDDQIDDAQGAWAGWDLPVACALDVADDEGEDLILVAIDDQLYWLDWSSYRDEWQWDAYAPLYSMVRTVPIPSQPDDRFPRVRGGTGAQPQDPYALAWKKRFRELAFVLEAAPTDARTRFRVAVEEVDRPATSRSTTLVTRQENRAQVAVQGLAFVVTLEHASDELFRVLWWEATFDVLAPRLRVSAVAS